MSSFIVMHPDPIQRVRLALEDIRAGRMVVLVDDEDRENEGDLVCATDAVTPEIINFMAKYGRGLICLTLTEERVRQLGLPMMAANNQSPYHTAFTVSIEARQGVTTGISAADRAHTCKVAIKPSAGPQDLVTPGHIFPLRARNGGVLVRTGQTEGSVDLARLADLTPSGVICEIMNDDGTMARLPDLLKFGEEHSIRVVTVADIIRWRIRHEVLVDRVSEMEIRTPHGVFQHRTYRSKTDGGVHMVLWKGDLTTDEPVLTRVQAFCPTGDVFGSPSCDCRSQLDSSLARIAEEGRGVFLYLHVAGDKHAASVVARIRSHLGESDAKSGDTGGGELREMGTGAQILLDLGARRLTLLTNNPRKIVGLEGYGLEVVDRVPIQAPLRPENAQYLAERRDQLGHLLPADAPAQS
jgi:3,4-dihydroxy 2-butanone 4-phosphate synthase/GTP cyclohydrolase II